MKFKSYQTRNLTWWKNRRAFLTWGALSCSISLIVKIFDVHASQAQQINSNSLSDGSLLPRYLKDQPQGTRRDTVQIEINCPDSIRNNEECRIRVLLFNDSYEPIVISRNAFVGPNLKALSGDGAPFPESVEATFGSSDEPLTLQPFTFYGRQRTFQGLLPGKIEVSAYYQQSEQDIFASHWLTVM